MKTMFPSMANFIARGQPFTRQTPWGNSPGVNERESHPETEITGAAAARSTKTADMSPVAYWQEYHSETAPSKSRRHIKVMPSL